MFVDMYPATEVGITTCGFFMSPPPLPTALPRFTHTEDTHPGANLTYTIMCTAAALLFVRGGTRHAVIETAAVDYIHYFYNPRAAAAAV